MADMTFEKAFAALKRGEVAGIYYLTGNEDVLKDELVEAIAAAVLDPSAKDFNFDVRTAGDLDGEALHALIETPPMLAARRMVVVRGIEQWRRNAKIWDVLIRYLDHPAETTVLVLTQAGDDRPDGRIAKAAAHIVVDALRPDLTTRWLARRAARAGVTLDPDAAEHLVAAVGAQLGHLAVELDKLAAAAEGSRVTATAVAELVGVRRGETAHDWVDAVLERDRRRALELLEVVLQQSGVSGVQLVMVLGTGLVGTRLARALADRGTSGARLAGELLRRLRAARPPRLRSWQLEAETWARAARHWSGDELEAALAAAATADRRLKSTTISDERGILTSMLLALPQARVAA